MISVKVIESLEDLGPYVAEWDALAVATGKPYSSARWMIAWWRNSAPRGALLRVFIVSDSSGIAAVAPLFVDRGFGGVTRCRVLGAGTSSRVDLLAVPGIGQDIASSLVVSVSNSIPRPAVVMFEGLPEGSPWPQFFAEIWPGRRAASLRTSYRQPAPVVVGRGMTFDTWMASKSPGFRANSRRRNRRLAELGGLLRLSGPNELKNDLESFASLHHRRWRSRGGSGVLNERIERMLASVAREKEGEPRIRLWCIDVDGQTISAHLFLAAGGEVSYWLGGFDERWAYLGPGMLAILAAIRHALTAGDSRIDLGAGGQEYKYRFADDADTLSWSLLIPPGLGAPLARVQLLRSEARMRLAQRLPPRAKRALRSAVGRFSVKRLPDRRMANRSTHAAGD